MAAERQLSESVRACSTGGGRAAGAGPHGQSRFDCTRSGGGEGQQDLQGTLISRRLMLSDLWHAPNPGGRIPGWVVSRPRQEVSTFSPRQALRGQLNDLSEARDGARCPWRWLATPSTATIFLPVRAPQSAPALGGSREPAFEDSGLFAVLPQPLIHSSRRSSNGQAQTLVRTSPPRLSHFAVSGPFVAARPTPAEPGCPSPVRLHRELPSSPWRRSNYPG